MQHEFKLSEINTAFLLENSNRRDYFGDIIIIRVILKWILKK
jgi:hypothetical protein